MYRNLNLPFSNRATYLTKSFNLLSIPLIIIVLIILQGCYSQNPQSFDRKHEIGRSLILTTGKDTIKAYELGVKPKYSSKDLQTFLFKKYGNWDFIIPIDRETPVLVWEQIKLLDNSDELFTVFASGENRQFKTVKINGKQKYGRLFYCTVSVFDSNNADCFAPASELREVLTNYFAEGVKSITKDDILGNE